MKKILLLGLLFANILTFAQNQNLSNLGPVQKAYKKIALGGKQITSGNLNEIYNPPSLLTAEVNPL
jgi:hypothetical protein